jgi:hypothetical protein
LFSNCTRVGDRLGLGGETVALVRLGAVAAAGHRQRQRPRFVAEAEMQRGEAAHRQADHMRLCDAQMIEHRQDVVRRAVLRIGIDRSRHVRGRVAARGKADRPMALPEMPHLGFPVAMIGGVFVDEDDRHAAAGFLEVQADAIIGDGEGHGRVLLGG